MTYINLTRDSTVARVFPTLLISDKTIEFQECGISDYHWFAVANCRVDR